MAPFIVETDTMSVKYIYTQKTLNGFSIRWAEIIEEFTFTVIHTKVVVEDVYSGRISRKRRQNIKYL